MKVAFSVVTVVRNAGASIEKTINSVIRQTEAKFEYIVIDGASTDGTTAVLDRYREFFSVLISEEDAGIYDAMNKAIQLARNEYLIFMNSGDTFQHDRVLAGFHRAIQSNPRADVVYGDYLDLGTLKCVTQRHVRNQYFFFRRTLCHQSAVVKVSTLRTHGGFSNNYLILADRDFFLRVSRSRGVFVKTNLLVCSWEDVGYSSSNRDVLNREVERFRRLNYPFLSLIAGLRSTICAMVLKIHQ